MTPRPRTRVRAPHLRGPHRVPPPITSGGETLEGMDVLQEFPGELGLLLWKTMRSITLWAVGSPADRGPGLFPPEAYERRTTHIAAAGLDDPPRRALEELARVLNDSTSNATVVAEQCRNIARWADEQAATGTALAYTQAAALAEPEDASLAFATGLIARRRAEYGRAESWFRQAIMLGRLADDWRSYSLASAGLGKLFVQRGAYTSARRHFIRGVRAAGRHSLWEIQGRIYHDLSAMSIRAGKSRDAAQYAARALQAYGPNHRAVPDLAHDIAYFWMERGYFAEALKVFEAMLPRTDRPAARLRASASLARAAAGAGDEAAFDRAQRATEEMIEEGRAPEDAAGALVELAHGGFALGRSGFAEQSAERALKLATERGEADVVLDAEAILDAVRRGEDAAARLRMTPKATTPNAVSRLADNLVAALAPEA